ncbi:hypothetical protein AC249_AIPGENE11064 [Exaiptasia diaphana]|nr:hypothetical protein AC249_AIPGENE11064 [Exaiptasia diaphana]
MEGFDSYPVTDYNTPSPAAADTWITLGDPDMKVKVKRSLYIKARDGSTDRRLTIHLDVSEWSISGRSAIYCRRTKIFDIYGIGEEKKTLPVAHKRLERSSLKDNLAAYRLDDRNTIGIRPEYRRNCSLEYQEFNGIIGRHSNGIPEMFAADDNIGLLPVKRKQVDWRKCIGQETERKAPPTERYSLAYKLLQVL